MKEAWSKSCSNSDNIWRFSIESSAKLFEYIVHPRVLEDLTNLTCDISDEDISLAKRQIASMELANPDGTVPFRSDRLYEIGDTSFICNKMRGNNRFPDLVTSMICHTNSLANDGYIDIMNPSTFVIPGAFRLTLHNETNRK